MYTVQRNGREILEADACGIGFVATRKGIAERRVVEFGLELTRQFDHRGAPGHGAGVQLEIPWGLLIDRFPRHIRALAQRDVAVGMFFLPYEASLRAECIEAVEDLAHLAGADVLQWAEVPIDPRALPEGSPSLRTIPVVRQALFKRPEGLSETGWFACRYMLRLALDAQVHRVAGDHFALVSLSNRTIIYKGLAELSKIDKLYPDLQDESVASRYLLFHSRYCTNTSTAWKRAQPFWALAHNGEITTIRGNVRWMQAIGKDLIRSLVEQHPELAGIAAKVDSIVCQGGSDTANLDDMAIALMAGGMTMPQSVLGLLPEAWKGRTQNEGIESFYQAMSVYLGACDGPAAIVCCDGDDAIAHLDRNGLRPLWVWADSTMVFAGSELTSSLMDKTPEVQRCLGPGNTFVCRLANGQLMFDDDCAPLLAKDPSFVPDFKKISSVEPAAIVEEDLPRLRRAFGMTKEDLEVVLEPLIKTGKAAIGSMGDDTPPAAMLDEMPRRLEDCFALRFAQETSPPVDSIRDEWVFEPSGWLGDRSGMWSGSSRGLYEIDSRVLSRGQLAWLYQQPGVERIELLHGVDEDPEAALGSLLTKAEKAAEDRWIIVLSDKGVDQKRVAASMVRMVSRLHTTLAQNGVRHRVGIVAEAGVWDINHVSLLIALGADAVQPWLGSVTAGESEATYLSGIRTGFVDVMAMVGVTPSSAYCGAALVEAIGLDPDFVAREFPGVPCHLGGLGPAILNKEWLTLHEAAYGDLYELPDVGEFRQSKDGRPHFNDAQVVRSIQAASGYSKKMHGTAPGSYEAYKVYSEIISTRKPITPLDCLKVIGAEPISIDEVEPVERILWRFMAPGMSEGAISEPAHRAVAQAFNVVYRLCRLKLGGEPFGIGPIANSGEGGFDKHRIGRRDGNRSVQYAGGRFTITPFVAASAAEAEVKFAQGAKPGKGGQLPGKKVSARVAHQRGCEPGFELVSPPINHNLYSIEDVKLMVESWKILNPDVNCALKFVATHGIEMVVVGGANAGAHRLHISDGCGGTGAAKRVDQKHAGVPVAAVLPRIQDMLAEEGLREQIELSVDGGVQNGEQVLKLILLGADRVGFGTSVLMAIGCSMLRKCHLAGPDPSDPTGKRRLGCAPGVATQDPALVANFKGRSKHVAKFLLHVATEVRELMAQAGIRRLEDVVGRRDWLEKKADLDGKSAHLHLDHLLNAPPSVRTKRVPRERNTTPADPMEADAAQRALAGENVVLERSLGEHNRCLGVTGAGILARAKGDLGLTSGSVHFKDHGAAGHFYAAYSLNGLSFEIDGVIADSCFTAAYGGTLVVRPQQGLDQLTLVGNAFGYGARGGRAFIAGRGGNRFGICFRKSHEGSGPEVVVEGVEANAFQYMTGGTALVLGSIGRNLGSGMTGGVVYALDFDRSVLNTKYVQALNLEEADADRVKSLLEEHVSKTGSPFANCLLKDYDATRFSKIVTKLVPEPIE